MAGLVPSIARSIAFGLGNNGETINDTKLQFEVGRSDITVTSFDFVNNKLIFKAPVDESFGGTIYEAALYSTANNSMAGQYASKILTVFDSNTEEWVDATSGVAGTYSTPNARIGGDSLQHTPSASATKTDSLTNIFLDFSGFSGADKFVFAFAVANGNTSSIRFQFHTDTTNYYQFALGAQTSGYKIVEAAKSSATVVGAPNWAQITEIRVSTSSTALGASNVEFDGIRIDDVDTFNQDYVMVSREVLATPFVKQAGRVQEIEFALDVGIA
jgi:hypothetical protein